MSILSNSCACPLPESQRMTHTWYWADTGLLDSCSHLCHISTNPTCMPSLCFTKKLGDSWWAVIILQPMESNVERQPYGISVIYSCLDSPAKSQTAFCQPLRTHSGETATVRRSLQARHNKNSTRRRGTCRSNLSSSAEQNQEDHKPGQYFGH